MRDKPEAIFLAAAVLVWNMLALPARAQDAKQEFAGSVVCQGCHEDIFKSFSRNAHRFLETDKWRGWEEKACESCHGPGTKHAESAAVEDILNPRKMEARLADRSCLTCHIRQPTNAGRVHGGHANGEVSCVACHTVHAPARPAASLRTQVCTGCHTATAVEFQRPFTHKLNQGAISCVDCHNPHGSQNRSFNLNASLQEPGCFKCHGDKRGPFTFEHAPVRQEGCNSCHQPHGSANPRMLTRHEVRLQCLECHTNLPRTEERAASSGLGGIPPAFHDLRSPRFRNCTVCHIKIHGSHVNRDFTR